MRTQISARSAAAESRNGAITVEFAAVLPVILLMFLGAVEMTNFNFIHHTAANAAYEGARAAMVAGGSSAQGIACAQRFLDRFGVGDGAEVTLTATSEAVTITVRVPMNHNSIGLSRFTTGLQVTQTASLRRERRQIDPGA
jgi:Flp pilus assembly protein TadG